MIVNREQPPASFPSKELWDTDVKLMQGETANIREGGGFGHILVRIEIIGVSRGGQRGESNKRVITDQGFAGGREKRTGRTGSLQLHKFKKGRIRNYKGIWVVPRRTNNPTE